MISGTRHISFLAQGFAPLRAHGLLVLQWQSGSIIRTASPDLADLVDRGCGEKDGLKKIRGCSTGKQGKIPDTD